MDYMERKEPNLVIDIGYTAPNLRKVLVVDDESALQTLIHDTLEGEYRLASAYNGRQGIDMATNMKPDVILMDVMMPDLGGYEAIRILHSSNVTKNIPIIVMTAKDFDDSTISEIKREPNVVGFLNKPFRPKNLREIIRAALDRPQPPA
jgi:putative two-component system response regulator